MLPITLSSVPNYWLPKSGIRNLESACMEGFHHAFLKPFLGTAYLKSANMEDYSFLKPLYIIYIYNTYIKIYTYIKTYKI